jgi:hypothetical protein
METAAEADKACETVNVYMSREERYESIKVRHWVKRKPTLWGPYFWVVNDDPTDVLVRLRIHLVGDAKQIGAIVAVEDNIEKHMAAKGFSVNVEFVGMEGADVFEIGANPTQWPNSLNWSGGNALVYAHELGHAMGLEDEYDRILAHSQNPYISIKDRLLLFLYQMHNPLPDDAAQGKMSDIRYPFLNRHVCFIAGLKEADCVKAREAAGE